MFCYGNRALVISNWHEKCKILNWRKQIELNIVSISLSTQMILILWEWYAKNAVAYIDAQIYL